MKVGASCTLIVNGVRFKGRIRGLGEQLAPDVTTMVLEIEFPTKRQRAEVTELLLEEFPADHPIHRQILPPR